MDKKNEYAKILLNAYNNGLFKIIWNTSGFSLIHFKTCLKVVIVYKIMELFIFM